MVTLSAAGHHRARVQADGAGWQSGPVVHAVDRLDREAVEQAVLDHGAGAGEAFLARLEDHDGAALEIAGLGQVARRAHQHGGVAVVAAAMHHPGAGGPPRELVVLGHRERVHVGAQAHHAPAGAASGRG
jgi:hypothetical protein